MSNAANTSIELRSSVLAFRIDETLQFVMTGTGVVKTFAADDLAFRIVAGLREGVDAQVLEGRVADSPDYSPAHFTEILDTLHGESLIQSTDAHCQFDNLGAVDVSKYDRQLRLFAEVVADGRAAGPAKAVDLQRRLGSATVVVLGVGALGGAVLAALGAAGVGKVRIVDNDKVELSNLNRQLLFGMDDVGRPKTDAATDRLMSSNADLEVSAFACHIRSDADLDDLIAGSDLVINCADQPSVIATSEWVSRACHRAGISHIVGGAYAAQLGGIGLAVIPGVTACWGCLRAETATDLGRNNAQPLVGRRGPAPAIAVVSATVGNLVAWEAIRLLTGMTPGLTDRWTEIDFWSLETQFRPIPRLAHCQRCGPSANYSKGQ